MQTTDNRYRILSWIMPALLIACNWAFILIFNTSHQEPNDTLAQTFCAILIVATLAFAWHMRQRFPYGVRDRWFSEHRIQRHSPQGAWELHFSAWESWLGYALINATLAFVWLFALLTLSQLSFVMTAMGAVIILMILWQSAYRWRAVWVGIDFLLLLTVLYVFREWRFERMMAQMARNVLDLLY